MDLDDSENDLIYLSALESIDNKVNAVQESHSNNTKPRQTNIVDFFAATNNHVHSMDLEAYKTWIYPTNMSIREYQLNIVQRALFTNTLVALPTGLGKTFIAAVVMYNYYRWFPKGKIIFMAPTKRKFCIHYFLNPKALVNQQMDACHTITGLSREFSVELTGSTNPEARKSIWKKNRVFFITPQVLQNDLVMGIFPTKDLVLLVLDEAHRGTGNYAYCEIIKSLKETLRAFRVLALSATPGSDTKTVASVVDNLLISKIEIRTEDSMDIIPYIHTRNLEFEIVELTEPIKNLTNLYSGIMSGYLKKLNDQRVYYETNPLNATAYMLMESRRRYLQNNVGPSAKTGALNGMIQGCFGIAHTLAYAYQLLVQHGIHSFFTYLEKYKVETLNKGNKASKSSLGLLQNPQFKTILDSINRMKASPGFSSHPKMDKLVEIILQHFSLNDSTSNSTTNSSSTRVIVFSQFRESVDEITKLLNQHSPLLRTMSFIGQSSGKGKKGFTQKDQLQVISEFQNGNYNVLVATSIGEEGLDIGQVDLIICYDSQNSPIRMLQRMGRTGRKRQGKVVLLLTKGKEEEAYKRSQDKYKSVQNAIIKDQGTKIKMYTPVKDVLPIGPKPVLVKMPLEIPPELPRNSLNVTKPLGKSKSLREGVIQLNNQELHELQTKFNSFPPPKLSLSRYIYRQIQPLPELNLKRSSRCKMFCELIEYMEQLITEEEFMTMGVSSFPLEHCDDPIILLSSSPSPCISPSFDLSLSPLPISPLPVSPLPVSPLPISPLPVSPLPVSPLQLHTLKVDPIQVREQEQVKEQEEEFFSESILLNALESHPDLDCISAIPSSIPSFKSPTPIQMSRKRRILLSDVSSSCIPLPTESPIQASNHLNNKLQELIDKRQLKKKRREPKERQELTSQQLQQQPKDKIKEKQFKKPKPKTLNISNELLELEAELSSNDQASSDTEGSDLDCDLSGFVVGNDYCTQNNTIGSNQGDTCIGFYRKSLLSPQVVIPGAFQFREITNHIPCTPMREDDSMDTPGSLVSFIVNDDDEEVLYDF